MMRTVVILLSLMLPALSLVAKEAQPLSDDPVIEARMMKLATDMRCLVCQNQSLAESHSDFAADLRQEMREMMQQGKTDQEIVDYMVARFGDFVLFKPPLKTTTVLLWFGPFILLVIGGTALIISLKRRRQRKQASLSAAEIARAERLLGDQAGGEHKI
jgi:cytochrome c-type biogenesis protein CcmH